MDNKNEIKFKINAVDNARTKAINYFLAFGCVLLVGRVGIKALVIILIGAEQWNKAKEKKQNMAYISPT